MIEPLFEEDIDETGDLHLDVAEAYIENGYYKQAEPILAKLVKSKTYDLVLQFKYIFTSLDVFIV